MSEQPAPRVLLTHFDWTLKRMEESLKNEPTEYYRDAALQRFGHTFDLAVKCLKTFAAEKGTECESAEQCFKFAAENHWLVPGADWQEMIDAYKKVNQRLKGNPADETFAKLDRYYKFFESLYENLKRVENH
ncbi:MAG: nucleotidyltransferase substrate binding protein [Nitrospinaceae bacterium]